MQKRGSLWGRGKSEYLLGTHRLDEHQQQHEHREQLLGGQGQHNHWRALTEPRRRVASAIHRAAFVGSQCANLLGLVNKRHLSG